MKEGRAEGEEGGRENGREKRSTKSAKAVPPIMALSGESIFQAGIRLRAPREPRGYNGLLLNASRGTRLNIK
jgi:hypothetical protein